MQARAKISALASSMRTARAPSISWTSQNGAIRLPGCEASPISVANGDAAAPPARQIRDQTSIDALDGSHELARPCARTKAANYPENAKTKTQQCKGRSES